MIPGQLYILFWHKVLAIQNSLSNWMGSLKKNMEFIEKLFSRELNSCMLLPLKKSLKYLFGIVNDPL